MTAKALMIVTDRNLNYIQTQIAKCTVGDVIKVLEPSRTLEQNAKFHAMIGDIAKQCTFLGKKWSLEDWKRLLVDAFENASGEPSKVVPSLDGRRIVSLGTQTREFGKRQAAEFVESLYAYGAENNVVWTPAALKAYRTIREAAEAPRGSHLRRVA